VNVELQAPASPIDALRQSLRVSKIKLQSTRLASIDILRGIVMVLMVLDHTRSFFTGLKFSPEDLAHTSGWLFFTRFVSHFCAPVFFLLAGAGGSLALSQGKSIEQVSKFFWTRGLWLVFIDLTVMAWGWTYTFPFWFSGVLWAIGWSMVAMSLLMRIPMRWLVGLGAGIVVGHNLLDSVNPAVFGKLAGLWMILHGHGVFWIVRNETFFFVLFPLIPWVGVMALGFGLGTLIRAGNWRKRVAAIGVALTVAFALLRIFHLYGNSQSSLAGGSAAGAWSIQPTLTLTVVSFFNTLKYPPSLQFLLMTLGPALIALAWFDTIDEEHWLARFFKVLGRVPLFFYVLHIYLVHAMAVWVAFAFHQPSPWLLSGGPMLRLIPQGYGHGLPFIYAMAFVAVLLLYPACKWFMKIKEQHRDKWWMSYL